MPQKMAIDSQKIAKKILQEIKKDRSVLGKRPRLAIVQVGKAGQATERFLAGKQKAGKALGIEVKLFKYSDKLSNTRLRRRLAALVHSNKNTGVILQLPLPEKFNTQYLLNSVPPPKDVEILSARALGRFLVGQSLIEPPMVGAIKAILQEHNLDYKTKNILLVGAGRLVGRPLALWLLREDVGFSVITENSPDPQSILADSDIVISGVGQAGFIKASQLKKGALLIDADQTKGGIGPIVVAQLFKNLVTLAQEEK